MSGNAILKELVTASKAGRPAGICSVCSANEYVIEAAMEETLASGGVCLIEATANQVNQFGGYTGMTPADFVSFCRKIASRTGLDEERLIFGGDHLGPLVWSAEEEEAAMEKAEALVRAYAAAGVQKIHIDASMRLGSDDPQAPLDPAVVARRAARLCRAAEEARPEGELPLYVVGSEVPIPGGATEAEEGISVTRSEDLRNEYELFKSAFLRQGGLRGEKICGKIEKNKVCGGTDMEPRILLETLAVAERLKDTTRHCYTRKGRHESVAEHCWMMTLMAYFVRDEFPEADMDKVIRMCLIHDLGEAFTGDIPSFDKTAENEKTEEKLLRDWVDTLPEFYREEMTALYGEMEKRETLEAKIYKAIDNLEAVIQHNISDLATWIPKEYELNKTYGDDKVAFSEYLRDLRAEVRRDTERKLGER